MQLKTILNRVEYFKSFLYGKVRWVDAAEPTIEVQIEADQMASVSQATPGPTSNKSVALPVMMTEQVHKDGAWADSWKHIYSYRGTEPQPANDVTQYNHNGQWKNAYQITRRFDDAGRVANETRQQWRGGQWVDADRDVYAFSGSGKLTPHLQQNHTGGTWVGQRKYEYTIDANDNPTVRDSYVKVDDQWLAILKRASSFTGGKKTQETLSAKIGDNWAPRYRYSYSHDNEGAVVETLGQRHYSGEWVKSAERRTPTQRCNRGGIARRLGRREKRLERYLHDQRGPKPEWIGHPRTVSRTGCRCWPR